MMQLSIIIIAALVVIAYAIYLLSPRSRNLAGLVLVAGLILNLLVEIFDYLAVSNPQDLYVWRNAGLICEGFLPLIWLYFSTIFYRDNTSRKPTPLQGFLLLGALLFCVAALSLPLEQLYYSPDFADEKILFLNQSAYLFYVGLMIYLTLAMVNLERTFSGLTQHQRWRVKLEIIGIGVVLAMSVVYYSQSLLYRSLDLSLLPARTLALILAVLLMAYSRLKRGQGSNIQLSQRAAFRSVVVLMVGLYLLGLGLLGEGMRYLGIPSQKTVFSVIGLFSTVIVLILLLSESLRRRLKTSLQRNFYRSKYDYREQWQLFTRRTSGSYSTDHLGMAILTLYCEIFGVKGGSIYLRNGETGEFTRCALCEMGLQTENLTASSPLVEQLASQGRVINPQNKLNDLLAEGQNRSDFAAVTVFIPLLYENQLEGFIALGPVINQAEIWGVEDFELMEMLASQSTSAILNQQLSDELAKSREMSAIGKVSTFVLHDLKNQVSGLAMLTDNARNYMDDPEFQTDMLETLEGTVDNMRNLISRLKDLKENNPLKVESCDLLEIVRAATRQNPEQVSIMGSTAMARVDSDEIYKVVLNLVLNALEASNEDGRVDVEVGCTDLAFIRVSDLGCGMTKDFIRDRLFRPFETTKQKGTGVGLYQARQVVEAHGGRIDVESQVGSGSTFTVWLEPGDQELLEQR